MTLQNDEIADTQDDWSDFRSLSSENKSKVIKNSDFSSIAEYESLLKTNLRDLYDFRSELRECAMSLRVVERDLILSEATMAQKIKAKKRIKCSRIKVTCAGIKY